MNRAEIAENDRAHGGRNDRAFPKMLLVQQIASGLMLGAIFALVAVAFTLTIGVLNFLNFSIPGIFVVGGMVCWALLERHGLPWYWSVAAGIGVCVVASLLVERCTYRYMKMRYGDATEHAIPLVSSLAFLILFENLILIQWGSDLQKFPSPWTDPNLRFDGLIIGVPALLSLVLSVGLVWALSYMLHRTRVGRAIRVIAESPQTALILGIQVTRIVPTVFIISGVLTGLAGVLFALNYLHVSPRMGDEMAAKGIAAMVIGGLGNVWGAIVGGILVGLIEVLSIHFLGSDMIKISVWGCFLLVLLIRPEGLFGHTGIGKGKF